MKFQTAIASVMVAEGISRSLFPVQANTRRVSSEKATSRWKMIQAASERRLDERPKNRFSQRLLGQQQQRSLDSAIQGQKEKANNGQGESSTNDLDLGILAPAVDPTNQNSQRSLESPFLIDPCHSTVEEIRDYVYFIGKKPIKSALERMCRIIAYDYGPDACATCELVEHDDGTYDFQLDCPKPENLECRNENGCEGGSLGMDLPCGRHGFCGSWESICPDCGVLCDTCSFSVTETNEHMEWHCQELTYDMRVARERYNREPANLEDLVDFLLYELDYMDMFMAECPNGTMAQTSDLDDEETILDPLQVDGTETAGADSAAEIASSPRVPIILAASVGLASAAVGFWI